MPGAGALHEGWRKRGKDIQQMTWPPLAKDKAEKTVWRAVQHMDVLEDWLRKQCRLTGLRERGCKVQGERRSNPTHKSASRGDAYIRFERIEGKEDWGTCSQCASWQPG